jgi:hypothetical protein
LRIEAPCSNPQGLNPGASDEDKYAILRIEDSLQFATGSFNREGEEIAAALDLNRQFWFPRVPRAVQV